MVTTRVPARLALLLMFILSVGSAACTPEAQEADHTAHGDQSAPADSVPLYSNLGTHHYEISTRVPGVQEYFNQGLRLYYAFNHAESIRAFEEAVKLDPDCAICYWGKALALGPNINAPIDSANSVAAFAAVQEAVAREGKASDRERALIRALSVRYAEVPPPDRSALDTAYMRAMEGLTEQYPDDQEIAVLYAESLMDLRPWQYWTADAKPQPGTDRMLAKLEKVSSINPDHPGACHFYIHAVEAVQPKRAVPCAERLAEQMPGAGHLVHMPGHIYIRVGRYLDAIKANEHATHADESYIRDQRPGAGIYTLGYYPHNYDFLAFAASMIGRERQATEAAEKMREIVPRDMAGEPGMTFMQHHLTRALQLYLRFGRWDEIMRAEAPDTALQHGMAMWRYARGRALAANGDLAGATEQLESLRAIANDSTVAAMRLEFNYAGAVQAIAVEVLAGHIAAARGDFDRAVQHLRAGVEREAELVYGEPPEWTIPVRQELGAVLLTAGRAADAERTYREDLEKFPANGWSLYGLARSLRAQGKSAESEKVMAEYRRVWEGEEPKLTAAAER